MTDSEWIPLSAAADRLGISTHAVRRRLKSGDLTGRQVGTRYGLAWEVCLNGSATVAAPSRRACATVAQDSREVDAEVIDRLGAIVGLVDRLQQEKAELYGQLGSFQERVLMLQAELSQAREQLALAAPKEEAETHNDTPLVAWKRLHDEPTAPNSRPWWRRWLG